MLNGIPQGTEHCENSLFKTFLFTRPSLSSEILCIKAVIVACCLCLYVCTGPELETAYEQATKTALIQNISLGKEGLEKPIHILTNPGKCIKSCLLSQNENAV